jgi:dihydroxyacid dehydratase/phosphogluconate dehydratase
MKDIDMLSRKVPVLCKVAPSSAYHVEDVNRAGGILGIMGELERGGLVDISVKRVDQMTLGEAIARYDITRESHTTEADELYLSAPSGLKNLTLGSQGVTKILTWTVPADAYAALSTVISKTGDLAFCTAISPVTVVLLKQPVSIHPSTISKDLPGYSNHRKMPVMRSLAKKYRREMP